MLGSDDAHCQGRAVWLGALLGVCLLMTGCSAAPTEVEEEETTSGRFAGVPVTLAEYELFEGDGASQQPRAGVIPYDLNTPLFSDYMSKYRFVKLPPGTTAKYHELNEFEFPVGTVIAKTFACPKDIRDASQGERLLETRILLHQPKGWLGMAYIWNDEQTEARLKLAGGTKDIEWIHYDGEVRKNNYIIPNANQCKGCHKWRSKTMLPIGPKARYLNGDFAYADGTDNQLARWSKMGVLEGCPAPADAPKVAVWDKPETGSVTQRARAWLEINCAHCHNPSGPARNSGLDLTIDQNEPYLYGVYRNPVAAGGGAGFRKFDIVPGKPDESILVYRIASTHPGIMMPELGKRMVHEEGVALVTEWVAEMGSNPPPTTQ